MGQFVRVESFEALKQFRARLCKFVEVVGVALDEAEVEMQRTGTWLQQEQPDYWKRQAAKRAEAYARAKSVLVRKKMQLTALGSRYSCIDEEKALAAAERQVEEARQKQANVRRWRHLFDDESYSYLGLAQGLRVALQADIPGALAQLDQMIAALEAYATETAPAEQRSVAPGAAGEASGTPGDLPSMARGTPAAPPADGQAYRMLRARTPSRAVPDATAVAALEIPWQPVGTADPAGQAALAGCGLARMAVADDDKVVVSRAAWQSARVYLERVRGVVSGDSGWYIGGADEHAAAAYDGVRAADVLAARPDWRAVLELPAGCLVVFDGAALVAVLDPQDAVLWFSGMRAAP